VLIFSPMIERDGEAPSADALSGQLAGRSLPNAEESMKEI